MKQAGLVALFTIGPLAAGLSVFLLAVALLVWVFSADDKMGLARLAVEAAITIAVGAALIIGVAYLAL
jgi:hypothetical protein